jgi:prolyl-tRNA synthetase
MMGGSESFDYLAPSGSGENTLVTCENGDYAADLEIARGVPRRPSSRGAGRAQRDRDAGHAHLRGAGRAALDRPGRDLEGDAGDARRRDARARALRGDDRLEEAKLQSTLGADFRPATDEEIVAGFGAEGGSLGPVGFSGPVIADETLREGQFVAGANRTGFHLRGVRRAGTSSPSSPTSGSRRKATPARSAAAAPLPDGDRGRPHLQARYQVLGGVRGQVSGRGRVEKPIVMGSYGIGPGRVLAGGRSSSTAARTGMVWPRRSRRTTSTRSSSAGTTRAGADRRGVAASLSARGLDVLLDDRELRPGEKFADADLIGCPVRVTVGKKTLEDGAVDLKDRISGDESRIARLDVAKRVVAC